MLSSKTKRELKVDQRQILIDSIEIGISSPHQILTWGERLLPNGKKVGQIKNSKTVNYKRFTPFRDGLFCERIFGPVTSFVCACGKKQPHTKASFCEKCEVEYIDQRSRRYRLGYISLLSPVTHVWYLKGRPSYLSLFLGKRKKTIVTLAYCNSYLMEHGISKKSDNVQSSDILPKKQISGLKKQSLPTFRNHNFLDPKPEKKEVYESKPVACSSVKKQLSHFLFTRKKSNSGVMGFLWGSCYKCKSLPAGAGGFATKISKKICTASVTSANLGGKATCPFGQRFARRFVRLCPKSQIPNPKANLRFFRPLQNKALYELIRMFEMSWPSSLSVRTALARKAFRYKRREPKNVNLFLKSRNETKISIKRYKNWYYQFPTSNFNSKKGIFLSKKQSFVKRSNKICAGNKNWTFLNQSIENGALQKGLKKETQGGVGIKRKFEENSYFSSLVFSYGTYFYSRQQTLPFLPSFVSHFYLRDALLNFMYSLPYYEDFPLLEYCHNKRWEPLRDVHKFMAHKTVDHLKNNSSDGGVELHQNYTTSFAPENSSCMSWGQVRRKRLGSLCYKCPSLRTNLTSQLDKVLFDSWTPPEAKNLNGAIKTNNKIYVASPERILCGKAPQPFQSKIVQFPKRGSRESHDFERLRGYKSYVNGITLDSCKKGREQFGKERQIEKKKIRRHFKNTFLSYKGLGGFPNSKALYFSRANANKSLPGCKQIGVGSYRQKEWDLPDIRQKATLPEENSKSLLSGLEMTAIREILSYTGGGALQQLLQQFNQHDLCKFLFAETQILRVLYETQIAIGSTPQDSETSFYNPFLQAQKSTCMQVYGSKEKQYTSTSLICNRAISSQTAFAKLSDRSVEIEPLSRSKPQSQRHTNPFANLGGKALTKRSFVRPCGQRFALVRGKDPCVSVCKSKNICAQKKWYNEFQNKTSDLQKKQILRISRRIYKMARRLKVTQLLTRNHRKPEWMILSHLPVLPPDLRPILQMSEKMIVASDLNIMYQRVIYRNNRHLRVRFIDFHLVTAIQRLVQDAVDRLIENGKGGSKPYYTQGGRPLKSLSDILKGKKGRFRLNLLGKRVDFSGRSVIVVSPLCKIHECGLPKDIALELYHYFLLRQLIVKKHCASIVTAKKMIKSKSSLMWDILRDLMYHHPVLLNRAPTLHRLGIQAFQPKLSLGNAILLHPLVCSGFNADFDGDQMGVHLPLSFAARAESWDLLWSRNNLLSPATGQPMLVPSQDMVLGFYYITASPPNRYKIPSSLPRVKLKDLRAGANKCKLGFTPQQKESSQGRGLSVDRSSDAVERSSKGNAKHQSRFVFEKTNRFVRLEDITASLQAGKIKLHQPVWLNWNGRTENEGFSQTPVELRVHSFGVQQSVYEKCISSNLFTKTRDFAGTNPSLRETLPTRLHSQPAKALYAKPLNTSFGFVRVPLNNRLQAFPRKNPTLIGYESLSSRTIDDYSFFISSEPITYCVRTTAGRVLLNNLIKTKP